MLGRATLEVALPDTAPVVAFDAGKPLALIAYLSCSPARSATREHLLDLLWADVEPDAGKHALRQTLWYLRRKLGDTVLSTAADRITLAAAIATDRERFLEAVERDDLDAVVTSYSGDFLPRFAAPGCTEFERWAELERARLRGLFVRCAEALARQRLAAGRAREAQALARRVRDLEPLNQSAWRLLLEAHLSANDAIGASVEADALDRLLAAESIDPEQPTRAVLRAIREADGARRDGGETSITTALVAELVGREREFATILARWDAARDGRGGHVHVSAPAGLGKTRLLGDIQGRLRATRARAVCVRAMLGMRDIPYGLVGELVAALAALPGARGVSPSAAAELVVLNPTLSSSYTGAPQPTRDGGDTARQRALAVRELISAVSEEHPLAVLIDDLHWCDAPSLLLLRGMLPVLGPTRTLVVTAARPTVAPPSADSGTTSVTLAPLSADATAALIVSLASLPAAKWADRLPAALQEASGGSPLLVLETLQLLIERGILVRADDGWQTSDAAALFATLQAGSALRARVLALGADERRVLTLVSAAGAPVPNEVLARAAARVGAGPGPPIAILGALEHRGLVARQDDAWSAAHDEIARTALDVAPPDALRDADAALGTTFAEDDADPRALRRAAPHLARARRDAELVACYRRFLRHAWRDGDRRSLRTLAAELLGAEADASQVERLTRGLGISDRVEALPTARMVTAIILLAMIPLSAALTRAALRSSPAAPPDAMLVALRPDGDRTDVYGVDIRNSTWAGLRTVEIPLASGPRWRAAPELASANAIVPRSDSEGWTISRPMPDSGGIDLLDVGVDGSARRLTFASGDDDMPAPTPDGSRVLFASGRWDSLSHYDLATYDRRTGAVSRLTRTDAQESGAWPSPDGSAIAFHRKHFTRQHDEICIGSFDATDIRCRAWSPDESPISPEGWAADGRLVITVRRDDILLLATLARIDGTIEPLGWVVGGRAELSPDGRWMLCQCRRSEDRQARWVVFPLTQPSDARPVVPVGGDTAGLRLTWGPVVKPSAHVERLEITTGARAAMLGVPYRLALRATTVDGRPVSVLRVRWRSLDTTIATIDSDGVVLPRRVGRLTIEASAGGWRVAQRELTIDQREFAAAFREDWSTGIGPRWRMFGQPAPRVVPDPRLGAALLAVSDGSFLSGVHTAQRLPLRDGLAVEAVVSDSFQLMQWRDVQLGVVDYAERVMAAWDHAANPVPYDPPRAQCAAAYPAGEGVWAGDSAIFHSSSGPHTALADPAWSRGQPFVVRVQVFPDGRCGVAIEGRARWISAPEAWSESAYVELRSNAWRTRALVGHVAVWTGVPPGVDWSAPLR